MDDIGISPEGLDIIEKAIEAVGGVDYFVCIVGLDGKCYSRIRSGHGERSIMNLDRELKLIGLVHKEVNMFMTESGTGEEY